MKNNQSSFKRAIYPGSFDPITYGHVDIVRRARDVFDEVIISVINNPQKSPVFGMTERKALIQEYFKDDSGIRVEEFSGLLVDYAVKKQIFTIIRGLRAVSDFDFEFQMALTNRSLFSAMKRPENLHSSSDEKLDTVFFMTDEKYSYLSSSVVRQIAEYGGDVSSYVPHNIEAALTEKFK